MLIRNRPIYGMINFNLRLLPMNTLVDLQENFITTLHEIVHILGFSSSLFPYFVDSSTKVKKQVV